MNKSVTIGRTMSFQSSSYYRNLKPLKEGQNENLLVEVLAKNSEPVYQVSAVMAKRILDNNREEFSLFCKTTRQKKVSGLLRKFYQSSIVLC